MTAGYHHFVIEQGATFSKILTLKDSSGTVINLTGYTIQGQVWDTARTAKAADIGVTYTNRTSGIIDFALTDTQTTTFTLNEYKYDLLFTNPAGLKEYWLEGSIYMSEGYTA